MRRRFGWAAALSLLVVALAGFQVQRAVAAPNLQTAVFAGGCFWCMESDMKSIPGVVAVMSGYTGGTVKNPSYQQVSSETTGHYESVKVTFDASKLSYQQLLARYWKLVDPTDDGGQFCDRGPSYKPAIFVNGPDQRRIAEGSRTVAAGNLKTGTMKAQILDLGPFYPAEDYHRDFATLHHDEYEIYRTGCGRDARLEQVWGRAG
jgi:peptide-methionine (S)-S-oxide reductase